MTWRQASWPERFIRNYREYRRILPRAGVWAALRWAWQEPVLPFLIGK